MRDANATIEALEGLLEGRAPEAGLTWLRAQAPTSQTIHAALGGARQLGGRALIGAFAERKRATLETPYGEMKIGHLRLDEVARALLLARLIAALAPSARAEALFGVYDTGDTEARVACLQALNLTEGLEPLQAMEMIRDAGRTYLDALLRAAWCHNPYVSAHLSDHDYRKAVLKALFLDIPVEDFIGLEARADATLAQSLCEYADERLAAGRTIPKPVWTISALNPRPGLIARLIGMLEHPLPDERLTAARALANARDPRALPFIVERLAREEAPEIITALRRAQDQSAL
ncbi:EboA domain-containing protein [Myxococcota bacterium]|nr:EboA domain-containing protein [Myxococcota bacterium]MBU1431394.1 EboA domain-containing protein [Myxococcota bacterium]MBU1900515.1 EboA domain-containing protein [Myxococcota bacterium]